MSISSGGISPGNSSRTDYGNKQELSKWTKDEIVQRVLELEDELMEFQESSKELEKALEDELQTLETNNSKLTTEINHKDVQIKELTEANRKIRLQLNLLDDQINNEKLKYDTDIRTLKQRVVDIEIANDNMESNDRLIQNKLENLSSFNSELIEKIALMENDLHLEKKSNIEKDLFIINYENTINDLQNKIAVLEGKRRQSKRYSKLPPSTPFSNRMSTHMKQSTNEPKESEDNEFETELSEVDISFLSMRDVLKAGPPISPHAEVNNNMRKSDSLQKLHDLSLKTEGLSNKVRSLRRESLYLNSPQIKSPSTTQLSNYTSHTKIDNAGKSTHDNRDNKENRDPQLKTLKSNTSTTFSGPAFEKSKTSKNLTTMLYKESMNPSSPFDPVPGLANGSTINGASKEQVKKKKSKTGNMLSSWFH